MDLRKAATARPSIPEECPAAVSANDREEAEHLASANPLEVREWEAPGWVAQVEVSAEDPEEASVAEEEVVVGQEQAVLADLEALPT